MLKIKKTFMFYFLLIIALILLVLNVLLKNRSESRKAQKLVVEKYLGKKLILPTELPILFKFNDSLLFGEKLFNNEYKICTSIWSDCIPCLYELMEWDTLINKLNVKGNVAFLFYTYTSDYKLFMQNMYPEITIQYPIILDTLNLFCTLNNINPNNKLYNTFLINEDDKVILIGNPIKGEAIKQLYFNTILRN
jgi:hypothetical protein